MGIGFTPSQTVKLEYLFKTGGETTVGEDTLTSNGTGGSSTASE
jgi:hypothetical protein